MRRTRGVILVAIGGILLVLAIFLVIAWIVGDDSPDRNGVGAPPLAGVVDLRPAG